MLGWIIFGIIAVVVIVIAILLWFVGDEDDSSCYNNGSVGYQESSNFGSKLAKGASKLVACCLHKN